MTLAIAVVAEDLSYLLSDTKLSYDQDVNPVGECPRQTFGLKTFFLNDQIAVAYSDTMEVAQSCIVQARKLVREKKEANEIANFFRDQCQKANGVDFLLVNNSEGRSVYKITRDIFAHLDAGIQWIGDWEAADRVLRNFDVQPIPPEGVFALSRNFQNLCDERQIQSVGGIVTLARGSQEGFRFIPTMALTSRPYVIAIDGTWQTVNWGNAAQGGFGYTTIASREVGRNGCGVHYFQGRCGHFFRVSLDENVFETLRWEGCDIQTATNALQTEVGFQVDFVGELGGQG